ncbi:MAG: glycosyltransferase family 39 protein [Candidatus Poribacteria bacterium]
MKTAMGNSIPFDRSFSSNKLFWLAVCAIFLLGAILRIYGLTQQSLWLDEANGIRIAEKSFPEIISELKDDVSPPLHYFMLHIWMKIFGSGELSTRAFVAIFGILLIPAIYYVGSSLFNRRVGLISAFIASVAQFHLRYSQEVRMYSMLALLGLLSAYLLYKALTTDTRTSWIGYTLCATLTIYTHNYGIFIAISGVVFFVICAIIQNTGWKKFLLAQCIIAVLYLPWLPVLILRQYGSSAIVGWIPYMRPYHVYETFITYSGLGFEVFNPAINNLITWAGFAVFICCFLAGVFSLRKYKRIFVPYIRKNTGLVLLLCYFFVTLAIPMLVSIKKPIYLTGRYSISAWPAFPLIVGLGASKIKNRYILSIVLAFMLSVSSISLYWYYSAWVKSYDRSIASFIESKATEDDLAVFVPSWIDIPINYYLRIPIKGLGYPWSSKREPPQDTQEEEFPRKPEAMVVLAKSKLGDSSGKIFFIYQESATWVENMHVVKRLFDENFTKMGSKRYGDIEVTIYN